MIPGEGQIPVFFPPHDPGRRVVPLALACGIGTVRLEDGPTPEAGRFQRVVAEGAKYFRAVTTPAEAAICCHPHAIGGGLPPQQALQLGRIAQAAGKPALFFDFGDDDTPSDLPYGLVYRTSLRRSLIRPRERAMPAACRPVRPGGQLPAIREKGQRPRIGFCGYVAGPGKRLLMRLRGQGQNVLGHQVRSAALSALRRAEKQGMVETDLVVHRHFGGGFLRFRQDKARVEQTRQAFERNLAAADYTLCARGAGNFSVRFYETLSAGRVPLLIDTDCVLPFEEEIDWRAHLVWVDAADVRRCGQVLAEFHARLSPTALQGLQEANRRLWESWLEPLTALRHICRSARNAPMQ